MGAFLAPLIGLAAGGISSLIGSKSGGANPFSGLFPGQSGAMSSVLGNVPGQIQQGNTAVGEGLGNLNTAGDFYKTILNGSTEATQRLLGPEVSTVMKQYDNAAKVAGNLGPRGGGKAGALAETQTGKAGAYGKLLGEVTPGAAEGVAGVGKAQGALGGNLINSANNTLGPTLGAASKAAETNAGAFSNLGSGLGKWLAAMITNKGGGGDTGSGLNLGTDGGMT